jgi:long-subunit fatty acid transport protein
MEVNSGRMIEINLQKTLAGKTGLFALMAGFILLLQTPIFAQPKDNSPYSRLGLGEMLFPTLSSGGFGGLTAAYADPFHINLQNPASYGTLMATTFEAGLFAKYSNFAFNDQSTKAWSGNLSHLSLAFPMRNPLNDLLEKKKRDFFWTMNIALLPNTQIGYDIQTLEVHPDVDTTLNIFQGTGGTNKLIWGNGFRYKNFSFGVNLGYLFGTLESERVVRFRNLGTSFEDRFLDNVNVRAFVWNLGVQYRHDFDKQKKEDPYYKGRSLIVGAYGNSSSNTTTKSTILRLRENFIYSPIISDTLFSVKDEKGEGTLPVEFSFGAMYQHTDKLRVGVEYNFAAWSKYENEGKPDQLFDSRRIAAGVEYMPNATSYNNYLERIRYRAGFYHRTDPRLDDLNHYAFTFGLGLPVILPRQQTSFVNLAFEIGKYETSNAIKETFARISLGFTLNDNSWFFKRKFG